MTSHDDEPAPIDQVLRFGSFRLLPGQQLLMDGDEPVPLGSRALDILVALVRRAGDIVSKDELIATVWPNLHVEESNLRVHVAGLRRALHDGEAGHRYVVTTPGRGYRFVAPVTAAALDVPTTAAEAAAAAAAMPVERASRLPAPEAAPAALPERPVSLPLPLDRVIGRAGAIQAITTQLPLRRLVTVVGPGGIGKTTVAVAAAQTVSQAYGDGVFFVDLAALADPALVPGALAAVFGLTIHSESALPAAIAFLQRRRRVLLVIDGCEHLIEAAAALAEEVLQAAPGVHVLATSREPLRAVGERVYRLPPLESPTATAGLTAAEALTYPGVDLFVERAAASADGYALSDADAPVVADICRRLDGIALAIELAAARVDAFGVRELAARLDDRFRILTVGRRTALPRHQTLAATLEWSYQLLPAAERALLNRLAVFAEAFSLEAAASVASDTEPTQVMLHVASLAAKSLLNVDRRDAAPRYRLLDTTRLFGFDKLRADGEHARASRRHAEYVMSLIGGMGTEAAGAMPSGGGGGGGSSSSSSGDGSAGIRSHVPDVRAALDWVFSAEGDAGLGVELTIAAVPIWVQLSLMGECRRRVEHALASLGPNEEGAGSQRRSRMLLSAALGWALMYGGGSTDAVGSAWARTLALAETLGDDSCRLRALWGLLINAFNKGDFRGALGRAEQFAEGAAASSDASDLVMADRLLGTSLHFLGDQGRARPLLERALDRYEAQPSQPSQRAFRFQSDQRVTIRYFLARVLWLQGYPDRAMRLAVDNIEEGRALGNALYFGSVLGQGACPIALLSGDLDAADRFGAMLLDHSDRHALSVWHSWARCFNGLVRFKRGDPAGLDAMRAELGAAGAIRSLPRFLLLLGELALGLGQAGEVARGLETVDAAIARCEANEERWLLPELLRIKGELKLLDGAADADAAAEAHFLRGIGLAHEQGALSLELRLTTSLARLRSPRRDDPGRNATDAAYERLASAYARFSEGFETEDLRAARLLLAETA